MPNLGCKLNPGIMDKDIRFEKPTFIDPLTGLFNRYYLYEFLPQEIKKAQVSNYPLGLFLIDIDNFKDLNDGYGHLTGDAVLKQFSEILKRSCRQTDMVLRYAGDEFMVLLPGVDRQKGIGLGQHLVQEVGKACFRSKNDDEVSLTISVGFSIFPDDAKGVEQLIDSADKALYLAKEKGRNQTAYIRDLIVRDMVSRIAPDPFPCPEFIGRKHEIEKIKGAFRENVLSQGLLYSLFISGETGQGKSRLLSEVAGYIRGNATLIQGRCFLKHRDDPYYLFSSALDNYFRDLGQDDPRLKRILSAVPEDELREVSLLLPTIKSSEGGRGDDNKQARSRLFRGFLHLLGEINRDAALALFFDDVQWADSASLELLHYIIGYENKKNIFIVLAFQDSEQGGMDNRRKTKIRQWLDYLGHPVNTAEIVLSSLTAEDSRMMIGKMFPGLKNSDRLSDLVFGITRGNLAFIEEIFKSLVENGILAYDNGWRLTVDLSSLDIPHSLEETIRKRLKKIDRETKETILQAAVIGDDFTVDMLKKIGGKNVGYIFEVMSRAKKGYLVRERKIGNFNFVNKATQDTLYNELGPQEREALHRKIGRALEQENQGDLYNVAADLSFHFANADQQAAANKYRRLIREKAATLFDPREVIDYLKYVSEQAVAAKEDIRMKAALSSSADLEIACLVRAIQAAVKNFRLYPVGSSIRANLINEMLKRLELIMEETPCLEIVESEKTLVINSRRLTVRQAQELGEEQFISLMIESDIKSISFIRGVDDRELNVFIGNLSRERRQIADKGGWGKICREEKLSHIRIEEFSYDPGLPQASKKASIEKKFGDAMIMDFLLGKIDRRDVGNKSLVSAISGHPEKLAQAINKIALSDKAGVSGGEADIVAEGVNKISSGIYREEGGHSAAVAKLSQVIRGLDPGIKSKFIRSQPEILGANRKNITPEIIAALPDEELLGLIRHIGGPDAASPLAIKDLMDKMLLDRGKKENVISGIASRLSRSGLDREVVDYLTDKTPWSKLSIKKRMEMILSLRPGDLGTLSPKMIGGFLEELLAGGRKDDIRDLLRSLSVKGARGEEAISGKIKAIIEEFLGREQRAAERIRPLCELLSAKMDYEGYAWILDMIRDMIGDFISSLNRDDFYSRLREYRGRGRYILIGEVYYALSGVLACDGSDGQGLSLRKYAEDFIRDILALHNSFAVLLSLFMDYFSSHPEKTAKIVMVMGEDPLQGLLDICLRWDKIVYDLFDGYALRKRISLVLKQVSGAAVEKLKQNLNSARDKEQMVILLELAGNLANEELISPLETVLYGQDGELRKQAILALGAMATNRSREALSAFLRLETNKEMRSFVRNALSRK
ncbi:MAG: diguanylate cyclase [Candidatus Omnitrophota bacterium]